MKLLVALPLLLCLGACANVAPYQRAYLAREDMALDGNPGFARAIEKTYAAKEAAQGGASVGGGGCGCN